MNSHSMANSTEKMVRNQLDFEMTRLETEGWDTNLQNPLNWTWKKKCYHTAIPSGFAFVVTIASSIYIPAIPSIQSTYGTSLTVALLPYSFYVFGQAWGPMLGAPLSETFGRRGTYVPYMILFVIFTLGAGGSKSIGALIVCRFFAGLFGSPALSVGAGTVADVWLPADRGIPMAVLVLVPFLGPSLGPLIGAYAVQGKDWRWTQWIVVFFAAAAALFACGMKETYQKILFSRLFKQPEFEGNKSKLCTSEKLKLVFTSTIFRPWQMFFTEIIVGTFAFYVGINFAIYYSFFAAFPYVFLTVYNFDLASRGLVFLGLAAGNIFAFCLVVLLNYALSRKGAQEVGTGKRIKNPPENRLLLAMFGGIFAPIGLFWFGWSAKPSVHWICPIIGSGVFAFGNFLVFMSYAIYVVDVYGPKTGASATATVAMLRSILGAAFPLFTVQMYQTLGIGWATSLLGFVVLALSLVPWLLYHYGPLLRRKSTYAVTEE